MFSPSKMLRPLFKLNVILDLFKCKVACFSKFVAGPCNPLICRTTVLTRHWATRGHGAVFPGSIQRFPVPPLGSSAVRPQKTQTQTQTMA